MSASQGESARRQGRARRLGKAFLQWTGTAGLLAATLYWVDVGEVSSRLGELDPAWVAAGLGVSAALYALVAFRWWFTAGRVDVELRYRDACIEYYGSMFLNRVLPVPAAGDVVRVFRHRARLRREGDEARYGPVVTSVVLERLSGQVGLALLMGAAAAAWYARGYEEVAPLVAAAVGVVLAIALIGLLAARRGAGGPRSGRVFADVRRGLIARGAWWIHLLTSTGAALLLVFKFYCAARAVGSELDFWTVLQVVPLVIGATTFIPLGFSGWGVREASTALLYGFVGLDTGAGVAVAVTLGAIGLVAVLPGAFVVLSPVERPSERPWWRRGDPSESLAHALAMMAGVGASAAMGEPAWLAVAGALALAAKIVRSAPAWTPSGSFGVANAVTAARASLLIAAIFAYADLSPWVFASLAGAVFALDGIDGWLARRRREASRFGASFDMEVDAFAIMALSLLLWLDGAAGPWVLIAGLWRYVYGALVAVVPTRGREPRSRFARAAFGIVFSLLIAAFVAEPAARLAAAVATAIVSISFLRSIGYSFFSAPPPTPPGGESPAEPLEQRRH